ncbi:hypothetical protein [Salinicola socius]|uniref:Uncharacterized protein n=1 Tax=Salinicola socius TaxID=404433 RepID=A0A1Q8SV63_9GAMM|nr:hypothetical protein [Salinicola socius]OLO05297.1 hypothetical protein BTW07_04510 [Salinicola socius]
MDKLPSWATILIAITGALGTIVTALATVFLWRVTTILARETTRMADASSQPHVVATLSPNRWSMIHFDLHVDNPGNAPAYDVTVTFDPPVENEDVREGYAPPLQNISVLKPGHGLSSYLTEYKSIKGVDFKVEISWKRKASDEAREYNSYTLSMSDQEGISKLGSDPLAQIANDIKKINEALSPVLRGNRKLKADVYDTSDREADRAAMMEWREEMRKKSDS